MKLPRGRHTVSGPELDARLHDIFDDGRTPGAPETLYDFLREVPMDPSTEPGSGHMRNVWNRLVSTPRAVAALALVVVVLAGALAVTVAGPRLAPAGAGPTPGPIPSRPAVPAGWVGTGSFGQSGPNGLWGGVAIPQPVPRIAIHVVCTGFDQLVVFADTQGDPPYTDGGPYEAVTFRCDMSGHETRVELTAPSGDFQQVWAVVIRNPASLVDTSFVVSIEIPVEGASPSPTPPPSL